mmetsp:Transcript_17387/g.56911  ORF Transcript_17387/g.56911 Transcript_17387/m.56911 type:complete len:220 (+) Transcript_17387:921-1580(+)|eukprot:scaffold6509_cov121-Isochrysis_galbana.AAC.1
MQPAPRQLRRRGGAVTVRKTWWVAPHRPARLGIGRHKLGDEAGVLDGCLPPARRDLPGLVDLVALVQVLLPRAAHGVAVVVLRVDRRQVDLLSRVDADDSAAARIVLILLLPISLAALAIERHKVNLFEVLLVLPQLLPPQLLLLLLHPLKLNLAALIQGHIRSDRLFCRIHQLRPHPRALLPLPTLSVEALLRLLAALLLARPLDRAHLLALLCHLCT